MSLVSVIMPAYNSEKTIERAIRSVLNQSYSNLELLVILNGCTDSTQNIVERLSQEDNRIKILHSEKGRVPARNLGLSIAKGDIIALQDTDDEWTIDKLQLQLPPILNNECDICGSQIECIDESWMSTEKQEQKRPTEHIQIISTLLQGWNCLANSSVVFRKSIINKTGTYDDCFPICEDYHIWLKAIPFCKFKIIDKVLMRYMVKSNNPEYNPTISKILCQMYLNLYLVRGIVR